MGFPQAVLDFPCTQPWRGTKRSRLNRWNGMHPIKLLLIVGALMGGVAHASDCVRVGKSQGSGWTFLRLDIGVEQGLFAKQGIEVEIAEPMA